MLALAWANLTHHRLRTILSALAVGLGLALFLVSKGLASGSIGEVADRMQSVQAELIILPNQENMIFSGGAVFGRRYEEHLLSLADEQGPITREVIPVFWANVKMGGQQQRLFGVHPEQMHLFLGARRVLDGKLFDRAHLLSERLAALRAETGSPNVARHITDDDLADGLELVIDDLLRGVGNGEREYRVGDFVRVMGKRFRIVGVVELGVAGRVFAPIDTLRHMLNYGEPQCSMFFIKLRDDVDPVGALGFLTRELGSDVRVQLASDYQGLLEKELGKVYMYINATNALALIVCFLFILLTMYTFVLERTREIGILKSLGMTRLGLVGLSMTEALLISLGGVVIGVGLSFAAKAILAARLPLLTVELSAEHLAAAVLIGIAGGLASALYPGWHAARLEPAHALAYE